jgi:hypothetical protein
LGFALPAFGLLERAIQLESAARRVTQKTPQISMRRRFADARFLMRYRFAA